MAPNFLFRTRFLYAAFLLTAVALTRAPLTAAGNWDLEIPYEKFALPNGLTVLVHEDRKTPIVAVNVWYHVGSKNEKPGKTGFAHLFEHLMFNGSENARDDYFQVMERIGATTLNGTTNEDRTNYFQDVPTTALDTALFLESDRMGHMLGAIDQAKLDEQRGVVQNEKRQFENQPYSVSYELMMANTYPKGHPYSWTIIGSMEDLTAASMEDVQEWFKTYYGPNNAVLVIAGDIDVKTAREKVEKYFGHIPPGPPLARHQAWPAKRSGVQRGVVEDRVPQARLYMVWNVPEASSAVTDYLKLVSDVLAQGKNSRLYKRLVYTDQIATSVTATIDLREIGSHFEITATAKAGESLEKIEKAVQEELAKLLASGPTQEELDRVKTQYLAGFTRALERIGGFGGKSDILARNLVYSGSADHYKVALARTREATAKDLQQAAKEWLSDGAYILEVRPYPKLAESKAGVDRAKIPEPGPAPELKLPALQRAKLSNGLGIVLAERHNVPLVTARLLIEGGYSADLTAVPGIARLTIDMLDEGTRTRTALQIADELEKLGTNLFSNAEADQSSITISALKANLDPSLDLMADIVLNPVFPEKEVVRLRQLQLAAIQREKASPMGVAERLFPALVYGTGHSYASPPSGTEESVARISAAMLRDFHVAWFKPNHATFLVVGDISMAELKPKLEKLFGAWKPGDIPARNIARVEHRSKPQIYVVDKPGALQSVIMAGHIAPPRDDPRDIALEVMNTALGGMFISRLNLNLREDKHWSYGARTIFSTQRGQRTVAAMAPVQTDKTKESMVEIQKELRDVIGSRPIDAEELKKSQDNRTLRLPGSQETGNALIASLTQIVRYGLPDDYFQTYPEKVGRLSSGDITDVAKSVMQPEKLVWLVVGDRAKVEAGIRELGYGEVTVIDADGKPVR